MHTIAELRRLHRSALDDTQVVLQDVRPVNLDQPTPCAGWDLRTLLGHVIGQNHGFAAAAETGDAPPEAYEDRPPAPDGIVEQWRESAERVTAAFADAPVGRRVRLVEISDDIRFPIDTVVGFHLLDTVVHNWDVATALGRPYRPDDALLSATLAQALHVPDGASRLSPGSAFAPGLARGGVDDWSDTLALLGRR